MRALLILLGYMAVLTSNISHCGSVNCSCEISETPSDSITLAVSWTTVSLSGSAVPTPW